MIGEGPCLLSYVAAHPNGMKKMVMLDTLLPGFGLEEAGNFSPNGGLWHFSFHSRSRICPRSWLMVRRTCTLIGFMIGPITSLQ